VEFKEMDNSVEPTDKELPFCYKEVRQRWQVSTFKGGRGQRLRKAWRLHEGFIYVTLLKHPRHLVRLGVKVSLL
jgi:hypothetical protein